MLGKEVATLSYTERVRRDPLRVVLALKCKGSVGVENCADDYVSGRETLFQKAHTRAGVSLGVSDAQ